MAQSPTSLELLVRFLVFSLLSQRFALLPLCEPLLFDHPATLLSDPGVVRVVELGGCSRMV